LTLTPAGSHAWVNSYATLTEPLLSTTAPDLLPPAVRDGPATAKLVSLALEGHGPATVGTLAWATGQSRRAVVNALSDLEDESPEK
jgi:hypothetical protein